VERTIFLVGPTAVGKTAVALELAPRLNAEIVSADSMQVYRGLDIGTAKPTAAERAAVRHHLVDVCEPGEVFDVKRFVELAEQAIAEIRSRGKVALVVGGSGLYVRALRQGMFTGPGRDEALRERLEAMPVEALFAELQQVDAATAERIDGQNPRRLVRALEVFYAGGKGMRELQREWNHGEPVGRLFGLRRSRAELVARIEARIDEQMAAGWLDEARGVMAGVTAMQAAGYRELAAHLRGESALPTAVNLIKIRTRQLAKRQMTWFRREAGLTWADVRENESPCDIAGRIFSQLEDV